MRNKRLIALGCAVLCILSGCTKQPDVNDDLPPMNEVSDVHIDDHSNDNNGVDLDVDVSEDDHSEEIDDSDIADVDISIDVDNHTEDNDGNIYVGTAEVDGSDSNNIIGCGNSINEIKAENITVYVDKVATRLEDVNGREVVPFVDNAEIYVPISSLGVILEKPVEWDRKNKAVYVGESPNRSTNMLDFLHGYDSQYITEYSFLESKGEDYFTMAGKKYTDGMVAASEYSYQNASINFNLEGKYKNLSFTFGHLDGTSMFPTKLTIKIDGYVVNDERLENIAAENYPIPISLDVENAMQIRFELNLDGRAGYAFTDMVLTESDALNSTADNSTAKE